MTFDDLVAVLGGSVGDDKARRALLDAVTDRELDPRRLTRRDALDVLDDLAGTKGIVGVAARFGRARLMLQWARDQLRNNFGD